MNYPYHWCFWVFTSYTFHSINPLSSPLAESLADPINPETPGNHQWNHHEMQWNHHINPPSTHPYFSPYKSIKPQFFQSFTWFLSTFFCWNSPHKTALGGLGASQGSGGGGLPSLDRAGFGASRLPTPPGGNDTDSTVFFIGCSSML